MDSRKMMMMMMMLLMMMWPWLDQRSFFGLSSLLFVRLDTVHGTTVVSPPFSRLPTS